MRKRIISIFTAFLIIISLFTACSGAPSYSDYIDSDKRIAVEAGDIYGDLSRSMFKARTQEYTNTDSMLEALNLGYVDAVLIGDGFVRRLENSGLYPDFEYIRVPDYIFINKSGSIFHTEELRNSYNEWFAKIAADGTLEEILDRWLGSELPAFGDIPKFELTGENGTLRVCDTGNYPPLSYYNNNVLVGFDMEMAQRFALELGMNIEVLLVEYEEIGEHVTTGKSDMSAATWAVTDEREETLLFGEPCLITQAVLIVKK